MLDSSYTCPCDHTTFFSLLSLVHGLVPFHENSVFPVDKTCDDGGATHELASCEA